MCHCFMLQSLIYNVCVVPSDTRCSRSEPEMCAAPDPEERPTWSGAGQRETADTWYSGLPRARTPSPTGSR